MNVIERGYFALVKHINRVLRIRVWHGMLEEGIIKWLWGSFGVRQALPSVDRSLIPLPIAIALHLRHSGLHQAAGPADCDGHGG